MKTKQLFIALTLALGLTLALSTTVFADDITVNTTDDEYGTDLSECSLREAIQAANTNASFGGCTHSGATGADTLIITPTGTITLQIGLGQLEITSSLTISGPGAGSLSISGNGASRVITTSSGITVTITGVTIQDGNTTADGGGIHNNGTLTLINSAIVSNTATQNGGGIYNSVTGMIEIRNTTIVSNTANGGGTDDGGGGIMNWGTLMLDDGALSRNTAHRGAAIRNEGPLTVTNSTISDNIARDSGKGHGGGIDNRGGPANIINTTFINNTATTNGGAIYHTSPTRNAALIVRNSTFSGNVAARGGAITNNGSNDGFTATLILVNSTFSGNRAIAGGGGIYNRAFAGGTTATFITNCTIVSNTADYDGIVTFSGQPEDGGGMFADWRATVYVKNTVIANNTDNSPITKTHDCGGEPAGVAFTSRDYNLIEDTTGCAINGTTTHNVTGQDPNLGPLADNGGDTWTHALLAGSPAVNTIPEGGNNYNGAPATDQRGISRPQGIACDVGAYEAQVELTLIKTVDDDTPDPGQRITYTVVIDNSGALTATNAFISDTLPAGLTFVTGSISLDPSGAGIAGTAPYTLAHSVTITPAQRITVTFAVTVNTGLIGGTVIVNTAAVTSTEVVTPQTGSVGITVNNVAPIADDDTPNADENDPPITIKVLDNDNDANGDALSISAVGLPITGSAAVSGTTQIVYTPTNQLAGYDDVFTYTVSDGSLTDTATVTVTVSADNDAPVAGDDTDSTNEDDPPITIAVLTNDSDPEGAGLTVSAIDTPNFGDASTNGATVTYTPTNQLAGYDDVFTYTVSDGSLTDTATVTVTVSADNDAPMADDDTDSTNEDTPVTISVLINDTDPENASLTVTDVSAPLSGSVTTNGNTVTYTPTQDFNGLDTFTYTISDGAMTDSARVTVTVNAVNDAPSFAKGGDQVVNEDTGLQIVGGWAMGISAGPPDEAGQTLAFALVTDNDALFSVLPAVDVSSGDLTYTPGDDAFGSATVIVTLQDSGGTADGGVDTSAPQIFTITVNPVNDVPSFTKGPDQVVNQNAGLRIVNGWATDISAGPPNEAGQTLTFTLVTNNDAIFSILPTVDATSGDLTYTPNFAASGTALVTVTLQDSGGTANGGVDTSAPQTFIITVTIPALRVIKTVEGPGGGTTDLPLGGVVTYTIVLSNSSDGAVTGVEMTDPLPSGVSFRAWVDQGSALLPPPGDTITWGPHDVLPHTDYLIRFTVDITTNGSFAGQSIVNTAGFNSINAGSGFDNATFTIATPSLSVLKTVEGSDGSTTDLPLGSVVTYTIVLNNSGGSMAAGVEMTDPLPSGVSFRAWVDQGSALLPPPGDTITWGPHDVPENTSYTIRFTADVTTTSAFAGETITNTVFFTSTNAGSGSDDAIFTIALAAINQPPIFTSTPITAATEDVTYTYAITTTDPDVGDALTITAPTLPGWLALADNGDGTATLSGTPTNADVGDHLVELQVRDTGGLTDTQPFTITVTAAGVNTPPTISDIEKQKTTVNTPTDPIPFTIEDNETDPDDLVLSVASSNITLVPTTTIEFSGSGVNRTVTITPTTSLTGMTIITVTVTDAGGLTDYTVFELTVEPFHIYLPLIARNY